MKKALAILMVFLLAVSVAVSGCIGSNGNGGGAGSPTGSPASTSSSTSSSAEVITLRTTGATFPQYQIQKWINVYMKSHPGVKIEYEGGGSGHGQDAFLKGLTQIGRSDPPVTEATWKKFLQTGDQPLQFPEIVGAVVVAYNVPGVSELKLDGETLAKIFMGGEIEYWDDDAIKALNPPNANLPHQKIIVVHRSDSSGTTAIFTTYLSLVSKEFAEKVGAGKLVDWPVDKMGRGGIGGKGNPGVVQALKSTKYSIAYTELSFAIEDKLNVVALKNKAGGNFVKPTDDSIKAAVAGVKSFIPGPTEGYKENLRQLLNAPR